MDIGDFYKGSVNGLKDILNLKLQNSGKSNPLQLIFANAYSVVLSEKDKEFDFIMKKSLVLPDGFSIFAASRILNVDIEEKISGPDFFETFLNYCENKSYRCFFLGGETDSDLKNFIEAIKSRYPSLLISGSFSPPYGTWDKKINEEIVTKINKSATDILWVGVGSPKQDKWIYHNIGKLEIKVAAGVGAAFNFISGKVKRAPRIMQKYGFEWLFRLLNEPGRLWKRYLVGNILFCYKIFKRILLRW